MPGGLVQIIYVGNQDKFLTQMPQITWFKIMYYRHISFAIQDYLLLPEQNITLSTIKNQKNSTEFILKQYADLVFRPVLKITLPDIEAEYTHDMQYYIDKFLQEIDLNNSSTNILLTSVDAILSKINNFTIYINNHTTVSYNYDNVKYGRYLNNSHVNTHFQSSEPLTSFDYVAKHRYIDIDNINIDKFNRNIYYSPYNINYLTTELSKLSPSEDIILNNNDYYNLFRETLYKFITTDDENRYIYSILNNKTPYDTGYSTKNIIATTPVEITFKLEYQFTNMKLLFIYNLTRQLKCIFYVNKFLYSTNTYINNVTPINNLYSTFETSLPSTMFISDGFNTNGNIQIYSITSVIKDNNTYLIESSLIAEANRLYFIYNTKSFTDQRNKFKNINSDMENYSDLMNNSSDSYPESIILPICVLTFNENTGHYEQIVFDYNITEDDYIYMYKDMLIYDQTIEQITHVIIGEKLYSVKNNFSPNTNDTIVYTDTINIYNPLPIINGKVKTMNDEDLFLVSNDENGLILVSMKNEIYISKNFIKPQQILLTVDETRLIKISSLSLLTLNLDSYQNTTFILNSLSDFNKPVSEKLAILNTNIMLTKSNNLSYIKSTIESIFNYLIVYKFYNNYSYKSSNETVSMTLNTQYITNLIKFLFPNSINGTNNYYCGLQDIISKAYNIFTDNIDTQFIEYIRSITNLTNTLQYINLLTNISQNSYSYYIPLTSPTIHYYNDPIKKLLLSKIVFQVDSTYAYIITNMSRLGVNVPSINGYYYVDDMLYEQINNGGNIMLLTPLTSNVCNGSYIFNTMLNRQITNGIYPFTSFYVVPNNLNISTINLNLYKIVLNRTTLNVFSTFDTLTNNNVKHFTNTLYSNYNNNKSKSTDIKYILYHYANELYADLRDRTNDLSQNLFTMYNNMRMYEQLWHIKQSIVKCANNGNTDNLINLNNGTNYYLDCNIIPTEFIDDVIINNSLRQFIEDYIVGSVMPKVINLLNGNMGWFSFYNNTTNIKFYTVNTNVSSLDVNLLLFNGTSTLKWYFFYLNAIMCDINDIIINDNAIYILSNPNIKTMKTLITFFKLKTNVFIGTSTYKGSRVNFTLNQYNAVILILKYVDELITYLMYSIQNRYIRTNSDTIIYTNDTNSSIINSVLFDNVTMETMLNSFPALYSYNFQLSYTYCDLLPFFNNFKIQYMSFYTTILDGIKANGSFSYNMCDKLLQNLNFNIDEYTKLLNWFNYDETYDPSTNVLLSRTGTNYFTNTFIGNTGNSSKYNFRISSIDDVNSSQSPIKIFYTEQQQIIDTGNDLLLSGKNILAIRYINLDDLIKRFDEFFTTNTSFYSDFRIIFVLYLYFYKTFKFTMNSRRYTITFNQYDNTSSLNSVTDGINTYPFSWIVFTTDDRTISYTVRNKKLYNDYLSININYIITYDMLIDKIIKKYDDEYSYTIVGENIIDTTGQFVFKIQNNTLYNERSENVGTIYVDKYGEEIFVIGQILFKKEILKTKQIVLFGNYRDINIINNQVIINDQVYTIIYNVFHDDLHRIKFKIILPFISDPYCENGNTNIYMRIIGGSFTSTESSQFSDGIVGTMYAEMIPYDLYDTNNIDIKNVFINAFTTRTLQSNIKYYQNTALMTLFNVDPYGICTVKNNVLKKLLHNICKNSILPFNNYIVDTIKILNYNNWIIDQNFKDALNDAILHNLNCINTIVIFNETKQEFIVPYDTYDPGNNVVFFVVKRLLHTVSNNTNIFTNSLDIMLNKCKIITKYELTVDYTLINLVKNLIISTIINDISNNTISKIFDPSVYFKKINNNVIWDTCMNNIDNNCYFIRNSMLINKEEYNFIQSFDNANYKLTYIDHHYYLNDCLITITDQIMEYDITYNNNFIKFVGNNTIIYSEFTPKTISIDNGRLTRVDDVDQEFYIDNGKLRHKLNYDISTHIFMTINKTFNEIIYNDSIVSDIPCVICDHIDIEDNEIIYDLENNYFAILDSSENILNEYVIINNHFVYVTWQKDNIIKIFTQSVLPLGANIIGRNIINALTLIGYDKLWHKSVFWYFESLIPSIDKLKKFIENNDDVFFKDQKFSCKNYIENLYNNMYMTINKTLFNTHVVSHLESKQTIYNTANFDYDSLDVVNNNLKSISNLYKTNIQNILLTVNRDPIPKCSWIDYIGNFVCDTIQFSMGSEIIEEINDHIIHIYNMKEITTNTSKAILTLCGHNTYLQVKQQKIKGMELYVQLPLCFNECSKALPLLALINTRLSVKCFIKDIYKLVKIPLNTTVKIKSKFKLELNMSYVYLEQEAKEKFARSKHEYLMEIKHCYNYKTNTNNGTILMDYNNPCKEMMWFYTDQRNQDNNNYWNYTTSDFQLYNPEMIDTISLNINDNDNVNANVNANVNINDNVVNFIRKLLPDNKTTIWSLTMENFNRIKHYVELEMNKLLPNPFINTALFFNGQNRFDMEGDRSNLLEPIIFMKKPAISGVNMKSFSRITDLPFMGYLNMSGAHDMRLEYVLDKPIINGDINIIVNTYQIIRIASGFGTALWR